VKVKGFMAVHPAASCCSLVELIEALRMAMDELIDVLGRGASIEAVLQLSAAGVAGEKHLGRKGGKIGVAW
jgi:hypothetical protein